MSATLMLNGGEQEAMPQECFAMELHMAWNHSTCTDIDDTLREVHAATADSVIHVPTTFKLEL